MTGCGKAVYLVVFIFLIIECRKEDTGPNDGWVPGAPWTDLRDNHVYRTIPIGDQVWMAENLAFLPSVSRIRDGSEDDIHNMLPFYYVCSYDGTDVHEAKATSGYSRYGVLYNIAAALDACPDGWHLPSDEEWMKLETSLGMSRAEAEKSGSRGSEEGRVLKSTWGWDYVPWYDRYGNGNNESGFTAMPGGMRGMDYSDKTLTSYIISGLGSFGIWWSSTHDPDVISYEYCWTRWLFYATDKISRGSYGGEEGHSVRCLKDK